MKGWEVDANGADAPMRLSVVRAEMGSFLEGAILKTLPFSSIRMMR